MLILLRPIELDIYAADINLAFEYHGAHHYTNVYRFGDPIAYANRDKQKKIKCKQVLIIPFFFIFIGGNYFSGSSLLVEF